MQRVEQLLAAHPLFKGLRPESVAALSACASEVHFAEQQFLAREGEVADSCLVLLEGAVALELHNSNRGAALIHTLGPGDLLGWSWLLEPHRWRVDARAVEAGRALALDGACLRQKCETDPRLGYEFLKRCVSVLAERLDSTRLQLLDFYSSGS